MKTMLQIRDSHEEEFSTLGKLLVEVYSQLDGFPTPVEQPRYYEMLAKIGRFTERPQTRVLVALADEQLVGGVVYFADMAQYGSGGIATTIRDASGFRLLGVSPGARGLGVGSALTRHCIGLARDNGHRHVVLHTTQAMQVAWAMYEKLGFVRSGDLDFIQEQLPVFGFRLML